MVHFFQWKTGIGWAFSAPLNPHQAQVSESLIMWGGANLPHKGNWLYWLYFCILCNKNGIKGLWGLKGLPSLVLGPALVLQWTLPLPYNTPDLAFLESETSAW